MTTLTGLLRLEELELSNQRVLVRLDLDVTADEPRWERTLDERLEAALPTLKHLMQAGARIVVAAHRGRPRGRPQEALGFEAVGLRLAELSGWEILLPDDCIGEAPKKAIMDLRPMQQLVLLENLRFHPGEESNDESFARQLAKLADIYVNDALNASSRPHASVQALPGLLPKRCMGLKLEAELTALGKIVTPEPPLVAVIGGTRLTERVELLEALLLPNHTLCLGGSLAMTFWAAQQRLEEPSSEKSGDLARARSVLESARDCGARLLLPVDAVVAEEGGSHRVVAFGELSPQDRLVDVGPETTQKFRDELTRAKTALWVGAMGLAGHPVFSTGTREMARSLADANAFSLVIGSAAVSACQQLEEAAKARIGHLCSGGGAALALLEGHHLPGLAALRLNH